MARSLPAECRYASGAIQVQGRPVHLCSIIYRFMLKKNHRPKMVHHHERKTAIMNRPLLLLIALLFRGITATGEMKPARHIPHTDNSSCSAAATLYDTGDNSSAWVLRLNSSEQYWHSDSCPKALWRSCIALGLLVLIVYTDGAIICDVCAAVPSGEPVCNDICGSYFCSSC